MVVYIKLHLVTLVTHSTRIHELMDIIHDSLESLGDVPGFRCDGGNFGKGKDVGKKQWLIGINRDQ